MCSNIVLTCFRIRAEEQVLLTDRHLLESGEVGDGVGTVSQFDCPCAQILVPVSQELHDVSMAVTDPDDVF